MYLTCHKSKNNSVLNFLLRKIYNSKKLINNTLQKSLSPKIKTPKPNNFLTKNH
jgi:hypothetical protein